VRLVQHSNYNRRSLWLSYLHDVTHRICYALPSCYLTSELTFHLPCEPRLWNCRSATEWFAVLNEPSSYGTKLERLLGVPFHQALHILRTSRSTNNELKLVLDPMSQHILIKALLGQLYALATPLEGLPEGEKWREDEIYRYQYSLHNWLGTWLNGPDTPTEGVEPTFLGNPLPSYWLAQISLMAYQEDMPPFQRDSASRTDSDARYRLVKWWYHCIRKFLRGAGGTLKGGATAALWDEMMKIRLEGWRLEMTGFVGNREFEDGLMDFMCVPGRN
jgi:hypothetical protein